MLRTGKASLFVLAVASLTLVGCSTEEPGTAEPASPQSNGSSPSPSSNDDGGLPGHGAPAVEEPLDVSKFEQDPCAALTPNQLNDLNLPEQGEVDKDSTAGPTCSWANVETSGLASIILVTAGGRGLTGVYDANSRGRYNVFEPVGDIEGHPAVIYATRAVSRSCTVSVGLRDDLSMDVGVRTSSSNQSGDACETVQGIAGYMLQTMKAAQ
ncbi:DUF3558 domain-containing protein [Tamaricihabitans halophyticus]